MKAHIVLGLTFGDEGKGHFVDYLVGLNHNSMVVRFSGGQQCGHAVIRNGIKHVFSNFGSGTIQNVPSYFSEHTTIFLNTLKNERNILNDKGLNPILYVHPLAKLTTPYDVAYNRVISRQNGHGSCGLGIGQTMHRNINTGYKLYAIDTTNESLMLQKLGKIKEYYENLCKPGEIKEFMEEYTKLEDEFFKILHDGGMFEIKKYDFLKSYDNLIFEGSQGILLDMDHGIFPNVTFANTTSKNALEICDKIGCENIETYYLTRCYQTRHGNGWMSNNDNIKIINNEEEINEQNEFQGKFRVGEIDYDLLGYSLSIDRIYNDSDGSLVITCLDQRPDFVFHHNKIKGTDNFKIYKSESPISESIYIDRF